MIPDEYKDRSQKENENDTLINMDDKNEKTTTIHIESQNNRRKIGNMYLFYYSDGNPIIVIGPHCKNIQNKNLKGLFLSVYSL